MLKLSAALLLTLFLAMPPHALAAPGRIDIPVTVDGGAVITVETAWPENRASAGPGAALGSIVP
jgi:hypothetical protein